MGDFRKDVENWLDLIEDRELGGAIVAAIADGNHLIGNTIGTPPEGMSILMSLLINQLAKFSDPVQPLEATIILLEELKKALEEGKDLEKVNFGEETDNAENR